MRKKAELKGVSSVIRELLCSLRISDLVRTGGETGKSQYLIHGRDSCEHEFSQGRSLAGCAEYMRFSVKESKQQEEPEITDEDHDAVNVLTIHSAKGLEYPVVVPGRS